MSRTDRSNKFYEGPGNPGLGLLNDILLTYCMYHFDLGESRVGISVGWVRAGGTKAWVEDDPSRIPQIADFGHTGRKGTCGILQQLTFYPLSMLLGYVQGMSDLLSPILYVTQSEVDAFWCFCGFMELVVRGQFWGLVTRLGVQ